MEGVDGLHADVRRIGFQPSRSSADRFASEFAEPGLLA